jgi:hypothetical protein
VGLSPSLTNANCKTFGRAWAIVVRPVWSWWEIELHPRYPLNLQRLLALHPRDQVFCGRYGDFRYGEAV